MSLLCYVILNVSEGLLERLQEELDALGKKWEADPQAVLCWSA
jgi:hypothetical protein